MKLPRSAYISSFNDVTEASLRKYSPVILSKLKDATHVAIDLEFTSLCRSRQKDMNHRYVSMKRVIEKGSMLSLGLSIFGKNSKANSLPKIEGVSQSAGGRPPFAESYVCDNFNFLTKKKIPYFMDTDTKEFLIKHGFQFDRLKKEGIPFMPPSTPVNHPPVQTPSITDTCTLQSVWSQITAELANNNIPLVVHNGLHDLIYIYNSLISPLPERWAEFVTRLPTHFPGGIYDTKHLVNNGPFGGVSFLPYVFGKSDRDRQDRFINSTKIKPYFEVLVNPAIDDAKIDVISTEEITTLADSHSSTKRKSSVDLEKTEIRKRKPDYCYEYAKYGYCKHKDLKNAEHDIQVILDNQLGPSIYPQVYTSNPLDIVDMEGHHTAHFDAYMTAFTFLYLKYTLSPEILEEGHNAVKLGSDNIPVRFPRGKLPTKQPNK